jgi:hypothetical protein
MREYDGGEVTTTVGDFLTAMMANAVKKHIQRNMEENNGSIDIDKLSIELAKDVMKAITKARNIKENPS